MSAPPLPEHRLGDHVHLLHDPSAPVRLVLGTGEHAGGVPLVECFTLESGRAIPDHRLSGSAQGLALRPVEKWMTHGTGDDGTWESWTVRQRDPESGVVTETLIETPPPPRPSGISLLNADP